MKTKTMQNRNPIARVVRALRPSVKPSGKLYRRSNQGKVVA